MALVLPNPSLNFLSWMFSFLLTKNQSCLLFLPFLFSVFWKSTIIQLSYLLEFGVHWAENMDRGHYSGLLRLALQTNLFKKNSIFLLVFWFVSCCWRRWGQGLVVVFFILHCIVFRLSNLFPPPSYVFSFFFLFFLPQGFSLGKVFWASVQPVSQFTAVLFDSSASSCQWGRAKWD